MDGGRWERVKRIVDEALEREVSERARFLDVTCRGDETLRREVDSLLEHEADGFLEPHAVAPLTGRTLSHYEVREEIGRGGMGIVYRALDTKLKREVAIKVLPPDLVADPRRKSRLVREAQAAAALNHPNIGTIHEIGEADEVDFIAMELVDGAPLSERLTQGPLPVVQTLNIAIDVARGLAKAHAHGIVHRDLKPANVLVNEEGLTKIIDFGIAKQRPESSTGEPHGVHGSDEGLTATREGSLLGTLAYMSPEQARGFPVDARSDVFSFGILLREMLTGTPPFQRPTGAETLDAILELPNPSLELGRSAATMLQPILNQCLAKRPGDRFSDADSLLSELERARDSLTASPRRIVGLLAALATGALAILIWLATNTNTTESIRLENADQLTTMQAADEDPSWSGDGTMLAFSRLQVDGDLPPDTDVWVVPLDGDPINRTPDHHGADRYPSFSPSGNLIAFWSAREGGGYYVMPALEGPAQRVRPVGRDGGHVGMSWSFDGTQLACIVYPGEGDPMLELITLESDESRRIPLARTTSAAGQPSWSPDGRFIAYVDGNFRDAVTRMYVLDLTTETAHALTDGRSGVYAPTWSSESDTLFYISNESGSGELWQQETDSSGRPSGDAVALSAGLEMRDSFSFSPDRSRLAFARGRLIANVWRVPIRADRITTWADAEQLTYESTYIESLDLSADETKLLVSSDRSGNLDLWVIPSAGGEMVQVTEDLGLDNGGRWSPDEREIVFYSTRSGNRDIWVMPSGGGAARQITTDPGDDWFPRWSPGGDIIAYWTDDDAREEIRKVSAQSGVGTSVFMDRDTDHRAPRFSPDGRYLAFLSGAPEEATVPWLVELSGAVVGEPVPLSATPTLEVAWDASGDHVYFTPFPGQGIFAINLEGGTERRVVDLSGRPGMIGQFALEVGREHIYFVWDQDKSDLWLMDVRRE